MSKGDAYRMPTEAPWSDAETWDAAVARLLGPRLTSDPACKRRRDALALAAAALRTAGEKDLACKAEHRATV
ncbi:hypothetical protein OR16_15284 [Cupriavidus basilensis OR16]|uniref:Uncharacterized protein n=1 Tax=Cupriavidus basilensis OR16 TaxID=1127483 RepID=H1S5D7_9BURK|nr:hypothetical protein [Cupriavidus basilensis]EHP42304.1 hypothetical protein OR16_15284 [Cupriavidus basilensis OR16]